MSRPALHRAIPAMPILAVLASVSGCRVRTRLDGWDFTATIFKGGDNYVAVRSDPFEGTFEK